MLDSLLSLIGIRSRRSFNFQSLESFRQAAEAHYRLGMKQPGMATYYLAHSLLIEVRLLGKRTSELRQCFREKMSADIEYNKSVVTLDVLRVFIDRYMSDRTSFQKCYCHAYGFAMAIRLTRYCANMLDQYQNACDDAMKTQFSQAACELYISSRVKVDSSLLEAGEVSNELYRHLEEMKWKSEPERKRLVALKKQNEEDARRRWEESPEGIRAKADEEAARQQADEERRKRLEDERLAKARAEQEVAAERVRREEQKRADDERALRQAELRHKEMEYERRVKEADAARRATEAEADRKQQEIDRKLEQSRRACSNLISIADTDLMLVNTQIEQIQASNHPAEIIEEETAVLNIKKQEILKRIVELRKSLAEMS